VVARDKGEMDGMLKGEREMQMEGEILLSIANLSEEEREGGRGRESSG